MYRLSVQYGAQELPGARVAKVLQDFPGRSLLDDLAWIEYEHPIGDIAGKLDSMRND